MRVEKIGHCELYLADSMATFKEEFQGRYWSIVTDPPYGMDYETWRRPEEFPDKIPGDTDALAMNWACTLHVPHSRYVFGRWDNLHHLPSQPKSAITWVKHNHTCGDTAHGHARQTEMIFFWPGAEHEWPTSRPNDVIKCPRSMELGHPTVKPRGLMDAVVGWTAGVVFDPFMGSGSTGVACVAQRRPFIGVELIERYFDLACERIEAEYSQGRLAL